MTQVTEVAVNNEADVLPVTRPVEGMTGPEQGQWTYDDYAKIPDDGNRYEVIDGVLYMSPAPRERHQASNTRFVGYLFMHVELGGLGYVRSAPYDVRLGPFANPVQPDVVVVLEDNKGIITDAGIEGVPDLVIEIASPGTATYDRNTKLNAYARAGIKEYWIADPASRTIELLVLTNGKYVAAGLFRGKAKLPSTVVPELPVEADQFFG